MLTLRLLGCGLICIFCFGVAAHKTAKLKARADTLYWLCTAAERVGVQISTTAAELYDILNTLEGASRHLILSRPFSVQIKMPQLTARERRYTEEFFSALGMGDCQSEQRRCEAFSAALRPIYDSALAEYRQKGRLYKMLGAFLGLAVSIIII